MGYIGNQQTEGYSQAPSKQDLTGATGTSLTLSHAVASAEGIDLFINNVRQEPTTAYSIGADGVTVTLTGSVVATDDIYVVYNSLALQTSTHPSNQALQATSGLFSGTVSAASATVTGDLTVDTSTLYVDSTNNNVGIGTASPSRTLTVNSGTTNTAFRLEGTDAEVAMQFYDGTKTSTISGGTSGIIFTPNTTVGDALSITATGQIRTTNRDFGFHNHLTTVSLADDASIVINAGTAGVGMLVIYETASGTNALYRIGYGSCAVLSGTGAVTMTNSNTDNAVCVFSTGHTITIRNRMGATKAFYINTFMAGNNFQENKMSITFTVDKFTTDEVENDDGSKTAKKLVGLRCVDASDNVLIVDKRLNIVDGTTDAQYVQQAYTAAQAEITEWSDGMSVQGMIFNPDSSSLSEAS